MQNNSTNIYRGRLIVVSVLIGFGGYGTVGAFRALVLHIPEQDVVGNWQIGTDLVIRGLVGLISAAVCFTVAWFQLDMAREYRKSVETESINIA